MKKRKIDKNVKVNFLILIRQCSKEDEKKQYGKLCNEVKETTLPMKAKHQKIKQIYKIALKYWIPGTIIPEKDKPKCFFFDEFKRLVEIETMTQKEQLEIVNDFLPKRDQSKMDTKLHKEGFLKFINNYNKAHLIKFYLSHKQRNDKELTKKSMISEWIYSRLFGVATSFEKRELEEAFINHLSHNELFYKLGRNSANTEDILVPIDIMKLIISFLEIGRNFLDTFGLVNEHFYILALSSFNAYLVNQKNINSIPIPVLNNLKVVSIDVAHRLGKKDLIKFMNHLKKVEVLQLFQRVRKFMLAMKNESFPTVTCLCIDSYPQYRDYPIDTIMKSVFPNLKALECNLRGFKERAGSSLDTLECLISNKELYLVHLNHFLRGVKKIKKLKEIHFKEIQTFLTSSGDDIKNYEVCQHSLSCCSSIRRISLVTKTEHFRQTAWESLELLSNLPNLEEITIELSITKFKKWKRRTFLDLSIFKKLKKLVFVEPELFFVLKNYRNEKMQTDDGEDTIVKENIKYLRSMKQISIIFVEKQELIDEEELTKFITLHDIYDIQSERNWETHPKIGESFGNQISFSRKFSHSFFEESLFSKFVA